MADYKVPIISGAVPSVNDVLHWNGDDWVCHDMTDSINTQIDSAISSLDSQLTSAVTSTAKVLSDATSDARSLASVAGGGGVTESHMDSAITSTAKVLSDVTSDVQSAVDSIYQIIERGDPASNDFVGNKESGTATSTSANHLVDLTATFETNNVAIGDYVHNTTDNTWAAVTVINSETDLTLDADIMVDTEAYYVGDLKMDVNWYDLDLSSIVPANAVFVILRVAILVNSSGPSISFRKNGNVNVINTSNVSAQVANTVVVQDCVVACDSNRIIEYQGSQAMWAAINICVKGWWVK